MTQPGNSETVSEKPKRGRPAGILGDLPVMEMLAFLTAGERHSRRNLQNIAYRQMAIVALRNSPDPKAFSWIADFEAMGKPGSPQRGRHACFKPGILTELGRLDDPYWICEIARQLCELEPKPATTREAVDILRRVRRSMVSAGGRG